MGRNSGLKSDNDSPHGEGFFLRKCHVHGRNQFLSNFVQKIPVVSRGFFLLLNQNKLASPNSLKTNTTIKKATAGSSSELKSKSDNDSPFAHCYFIILKLKRMCPFYHRN